MLTLLAEHALAASLPAWFVILKMAAWHACRFPIRTWPTDKASIKACSHSRAHDTPPWYPRISVMPYSIMAVFTIHDAIVTMYNASNFAAVHFVIEQHVGKK